jgi:hypothetical protein
MSENVAERKTSKRWLMLRRALVPLGCLLVAGNAVFTPILFSLNAARAREIQESRVAAAEFSCLQTNERHDKTLAQFETEIEALPEDKQTDARKGSRGLLRIFEASVPFRPDCGAYARRVVLRP